MKIDTTDYFNSSKVSSPAPAGKTKGNLALIQKHSKSVEETCPFRKLIQEWLDACRANGLATKTLTDYSDKVHKFWWWWVEGSHLADERGGSHPENVGVKEARAFVTYLRTPQAFRWGITHPVNNKSVHELSPASIAAYGRTVKAFFNWLVQEDVIEISPFKKAVSFTTAKKERVIKRLDEDNLSTIFKYLMQPDRLETFPGKRDLAIFALLLDSGIRRGECLNLKTEDIDLAKSRCKVSGKTGGRWAYFQHECKVALRSYLTAREEMNARALPDLWLAYDGEPLAYYGFSGVVRRAEAACGVRFHCHQFRHTFGSLMVEQGIDPFALKELMGHSSITTTQIYVQQSEARLAEAYRTRSPLGSLDVVSQSMKRRAGRPRKEKKKESNYTAS